MCFRAETGLLRDIIQVRGIPLSIVVADALPVAGDKKSAAHKTRDRPPPPEPVIAPLCRFD